MIALPPGWTRRHHAGATLMFPPEGVARGGLRYVEHLAPLAPVSELLAAYLDDPGFVVDRTSPVERLLTDEGEHAAVVTVGGTVAGRPAQRDVGFVLLDHHYARLGSIALDPADFAARTALVRSLIGRDVQLAGDRPRRFEYGAPPGWQARARGLHADWYPLDYPRRAAVLHVLPAQPRDRVGSAAELLAALDHGAWWAVEQAPARALTTPHGLAGLAHAAIGAVAGQPETRRFASALEDHRYVYAAQLECALDDDDAAQVLDALVASIEPLRPRPPRSEAGLAHWGE